MHVRTETRLSSAVLSASARLLACLLLGTPVLAAEQAVQAEQRTPSLNPAVRRGSFASLREFKFTGPIEPRPNREINNEVIPKAHPAAPVKRDPVLQKRFGTSQPDQLGQFEGLSEQDNIATIGGAIVPPDTNGDVGPNHYIQYINLIFSIYDKSGATVLGPFPGNVFWQSLGGPCKDNNNGDPIVKYDRLADRWVFTQFALPNFPAGPSYQCFAVSQTSDPTDGYWVYQFTIGSDTLGWGDYPKLGIWPDAYYMTFNMFTPSFNGMGSYAFDRSSMLNGDPASSISFQPFDGGGLPSDLDGPTPPPVGSPNYLMTWWNNSPGTLNEYQFHVDWATPANSTFTGPVAIPVADFLSPVCSGFRNQCVPQLGSPELLETLESDMMYRLAYRNFGDHESLVVNHTVGTESGGAGVRWYEIRTPGDTPTVYQQGTYAPDAGFRWMGSIAMDRNGNIALGYSRSSTSLHPQIAITGRLVGDPLGTMGAEDIVVAGTGSQVSSVNRWGDYSSMAVDPTDDCTFWYTQEYYASTAAFDFKTRIGSFRFPSCTSGPTGILEGTVTNGSAPLAGATITATPAATRPTVINAAGDSTTTTDASGHYQFLTLPTGDYGVTAARVGYGQSSANVSVSSGGDTVQDFVLSTTNTVLVNGLVKDGSGEGWPLYAKIDISAAGGFPGASLYTDPLTGYYSLSLYQGLTYNFVVTAMSPGYLPGGGPLSLPPPPSAPGAPGGVVANWLLNVGATCDAPGYALGSFGPAVLTEGFDAGVIPPGWSVDSVSGSAVWQVYTGGDPCDEFSGNRTGGSGPYAILNSNCDSDEANNDVSFLVTKPFDLSSSKNALIRWANDFIDLGAGSVADVDASTDGGASWRNIWESKVDVPGPGPQSADLSFAAGKANVQARFRYQGFWAWWWQVDDVQVGPVACTPLPGGLVFGTVKDSNTGLGLNGAMVLNLPDDGSVTTAPMPGQGEGYYTLFSGSGSQSFEASDKGYTSVTKSSTVIPNSVVRLDFSLPAARLNAAPRPLSAIVDPGGVAEKTLNISNSGTGSGSFALVEINAPAPIQPTGPNSSFDPNARKAAIKRIRFDKLNSGGTEPVPPPANLPKNVPQTPGAGDVVSSFDSGLDGGWGVAFNTDAGNLWISNPDDPPDGKFGDGLEYQYLPGGTQTGETIDITNSGGSWQADATYNARTGMIWEVNVSGDNCLFEIDPVAKVVTGNEICSGWPTSQRAVAYDPASDTYYVSGYNDVVVYHIDTAGNLLDSASVGVAPAGMAYNPVTGHLFLYTRSSPPYDVWVVDPKNDYSMVSGFVVMNSGTPLNPTAAGMEIDCDGRLWLYDLNTSAVYQVESGEAAGACISGIPWLSETPTSGTVPGSGGGSHPATIGTNPFPVAVSFDSTGLPPGLRQGQLVMNADTPYAPPPAVTVDLTVRFADVPDNSFAWNFIYGAAGAGVMPGCAPLSPTFDFCPDVLVTRRSMAGFIERAIHGALTPPPIYLGEFDDVAIGSFNADYIQGLVDDQITAGCSLAPPLYCPDLPIPREQMAVFILLGEHGSDYRPPDCTTQLFDDVPCSVPASSGFAPWVNQLYREGITAGCSTTPKLFCPNHDPSNTVDPNNGWSTNAQMAVFLVTAFKLPYVP